MSVGPLDGLVTGLNTSQIISQLMAAEKIPQQALETAQTAAQTQGRVWDDIGAKLTALGTAARALSSASSTASMTAVSTDPTVLQTTTGPGATAGSVTFQVTSLASANQIASAALTSTSALVGAGAVTIAAGASSLGISNIAAGASVAAGQSALSVTQASGAAVLNGVAPSYPFVIDSTNNNLQFSISGVLHTATLTAGTYSSLDSIASQISAQLSGAGKATVVNGALQLSTANEGSTQTLSGVGGSAASALGLAGLAGASATGTDGLVSFNGTQVSVTNTSAASTVAIGDSTLTMGGGHLALGTATATVIRTDGSTTLAGLAAAINTAGGTTGTVRASAISTDSSGSGAKLVLSAAVTGSANAITIDSGGLSVFAGGFTTLRQATDAVLTLGTGANALSVTRSTNTVSDLAPGLTLNLLKAAPGEDVTVTTSADTAGLSAKAKAMVDALNTVATTLSSDTAYDPKTNTAGILLGDSRIQSLQRSLYDVLHIALPSGSVRSMSQLGIQTDKDGAFTFDATAFAAALTADPTSVAKLLSRGGTSTDPRLSFVAATSAAASGAPTVVVTTAAQQAQADGQSFSTLTSQETLTVTMSGKTATFTAGAGSNVGAVAAGLQAALANAGLAMSASVVNGAVHLQSTGYGTSATFSVASSLASGPGTSGLGGSSANSPQSFNGVNVQATIGGVPTTGSGQAITATSGSGLGITMLISASTADVAGAGGSLSLGSMTYSPGAAGTLEALADAATGPNGLTVTAKAGTVTASGDLQTQIDDWGIRLAGIQAAYTKQFADMETMIGQLRSQQSQLTAAIGGLPTTP